MAKKKATVKANSAFMRKLTLSPELQAVCGKGPMPRTEITKNLWVYIKKHDLQDPDNRRNIKPDEALAKIFGSKKAISMFKMPGHINKHVE
jgi:chromatin remodeling complex protein RSC6